jgi:predicted permease
MFERTLAELRAVPGARAAALVRAVPLGGNMETAPTAFDGRPLTDPEHALQVQVNVVSEGYFAAAGLPLRAGRDLDARDDARAPMVAVVSEELARRAWPGESPLGKRLRPAQWERWATVVGVVPVAKHALLTEPPRPQLYVSFRQRPLIFTGAVVRAAAGPDAERRAEALGDAVRRAVWRVDADQPIWRVRTMRTLLAGAVGGARGLATLTVTFALVALALAAVGVFGVMSFAVAQRRRELGIRIALGARAGQVTAMVVRHGLRLTAVALALGLAGALGAGRLIAGQLYGITPTDPATLAAVAGALALVVLLACWGPARRAGRVDPKASLQAE